MNIAESMTSSLIRYSMRKHCSANILISGPLYAGKKGIAETVADFLTIEASMNYVTIFYQDDYYKSFEQLPDAIMSVKDYDIIEAFNVKKMDKDIRTFVEEGHVMVSKLSTKRFTPKGLETRLEVLESKNSNTVNIYVGPHMIKLLRRNHCIKDAIGIYINAPLDACMERRKNNRFMFPEEALDNDELYKKFYNHVREATECYIEPQKEMADVVINV